MPRCIFIVRPPFTKVQVGGSGWRFRHPQVFDRLGNARVSDQVSRHVMGHPMEGMAAFTSLYMTGVFERFPTLRVGFMESGCGWLPFLADRIDEHLEHVYRRQRDEFGLTQRAVDIVREGRITIGFEGDDRFVRSNIELFGPQSVVWASDYPHRDALFPGTTDAVLERDDLTPNELAAAIGGNAIKFFGLPKESLMRAVSLVANHIPDSL